MKSLASILFILWVAFSYSQPTEDEFIIKFYALKVVDTIYNPVEINQINEKHFFYLDENTMNEKLFLCSIQREKEVFGEKTLLFQQTLVKKIQDVWVLYDYESYWGFPNQGLIDNTFYVITDRSGNSGHNGESGGDWSWGKESIYILDYEKMTISSEIVSSYGYNSNYLESEEDIIRYKNSETDDLVYISTSIECGINYVIQNSVLTISQSYCKNETSRNKGEKTELFQETNINCPCLTNGKYHYIDGIFVKTN